MSQTGPRHRRRVLTLLPSVGSYSGLLNLVYLGLKPLWGFLAAENMPRIESSINNGHVPPYLCIGDKMEVTLSLIPRVSFLSLRAPLESLHQLTYLSLPVLIFFRNTFAHCMQYPALRQRITLPKYHPLTMAASSTGHCPSNHCQKSPKIHHALC